MKIAYVCNEYPPAPHGGIGIFVHTIAHGMRAAGHEVSVVGWGENPGERDDAGIHVITLPQSKIRGMAWWVNRTRICRWLKREATSGNIDIVEAPEFQGPLIARPGKIPVVLRLHLSATAIAKHAGKEVRGLTRYCEKRALSKFHAWIAVSHYVQKLTEETFGLSPERSATIYNPVPSITVPDSPLPVLPGLFVFYVGTISKRKGAYILAEAAKTFLQRKIDLHLVYAGSPALEDAESAHDRVVSIVGSQLAQRVHFLGRLTHPTTMACMSKAVAVVLPSTLEAFSLVPLEAMACHVPVIYTREASGPELIEHEVNGLLCDPNDASNISEQVLRILDDKPFARYLTENARRTLSSRFSLDRCLEESVKFYEAALRGIPKETKYHAR